jgi:hypothetical protein
MSTFLPEVRFQPLRPLAIARVVCDPLSLSPPGAMPTPNRLSGTVLFRRNVVFLRAWQCCWSRIASSFTCRIPAIDNPHPIFCRYCDKRIALYSAWGGGQRMTRAILRRSKEQGEHLGDDSSFPQTCRFDRCQHCAVGHS